LPSVAKRVVFGVATFSDEGIEATIEDQGSTYEKTNGGKYAPYMRIRSDKPVKLDRLHAALERYSASRNNS
jgi:hypothetical protein